MHASLYYWGFRGTRRKITPGYFESQEVQPLRLCISVVLYCGVAEMIPVSPRNGRQHKAHGESASGRYTARKQARARSAGDSIKPKASPRALGTQHGNRREPAQRATA